MSLVEKNAFSVFDNAERLAETMYELAQWSKTHPNAQRYTANIIKLPPTLMAHKKNLVAMIKTLAEYEEGMSDGGFPKLADLPQRYNKNGGGPKLSSKDLRRVHNWLQQVAFGIRAAVIENEQCSMSRTASSTSIAENVLEKLYLNCERRAFVTYSPDNRYELKPLRHASNDAKRQWIEQEIDQKAQAQSYGARPNPLQWELYGLKGHAKSANAEIAAEIESLIRIAQEFDKSGRYEEADEIDVRLVQMKYSFELFNRMDGDS